MRTHPTLAVVALTLAATACGGDRTRAKGVVASVVKDDAGVSRTTGAKPRPPTSRVLVTIVIDQMAAWIAEERWPLLPPTGGFARLRREGTWAKDVRYAHAATDTAPGHSSLYTGAPPRVSGIHGNEVFDEGHMRVSILKDSTSRAVAPEGQRDWASSSIARLQVDTVADKLRAAHPDALIASFSLKDRGAIFGGGRKPTTTLWFDGAYGGFVTSTAFASEVPKWAVPFAGAAVVQTKLARKWPLLDAEFVRAHAATPDAQPGEGDIGGLGISFPHDYAGNGAPTLAARVNPAADEAIFALGLAAMDAEGAGTRPTLVALSLSTNDYVGHTFGPDSWEAWDELSRLDAALGRFLGELDARFGSDGWALLLAADHGVTTMPEATLVPASRPWCQGDGAKKDRWERPCGTVGRLYPDAIAKELDRAAAKATGVPGMIEGIADPYVYFTNKAHGLPAPKKDALIAAVRAALSRNPFVAAVFSSEDVASPCPPDEDTSTAALVCRSFPSAAADLFVVPTAGSFWDPLYVFGKGSSHGSPNLFDRAVPVLARAPGRIDAGRVVEEPVGFQVFARTASVLLNVPPPAAAASGVALTRESKAKRDDSSSRGSRETLVTP